MCECCVPIKLIGLPKYLFTYELFHFNEQGSQITCFPMSLFEKARRGIFQITKKEAIWEEEKLIESAVVSSASN